VETTSLRQAIAAYIAQGPWHHVTDTCERLGLKPPPEDEKKRNKETYVYDCLESIPSDDYLNLAINLHKENPDKDLRRAIVPFLPKQIKPEIRRRIIEELAHLQSVRGEFLHGTLKPTEFLHRVGCEPPLDALLFSVFGAGKEPQTDITPYLTGLLEETDDTFLDFLRLVLHPTTRFQRGRHEQSLLFLGDLVFTLNKHLPAVGF
jgi:hypothetical protein